MRPLVLERGRLGGEATTASSGIVYGHHGSDGLARLSRDSYAVLPSEIEELKELGGVDAELIKCGRLDVALTDAEASLLRGEVGPHAEQGLAAEWLDSEQARELEPALSESILGGLHVPDVSAVNNQRLSDAYAAAATRLGARVPSRRGHRGSHAQRPRRRPGFDCTRETSRPATSSSRLAPGAGCWGSR